MMIIIQSHDGRQSYNVALMRYSLDRGLDLNNHYLQQSLREPSDNDVILIFAHSLDLHSKVPYFLNILLPNK